MTTRKATPKVDIDSTRSKLSQLGLATAADRLEDLLSDAVKMEEPPHRFLDRILELESNTREERRVRTSLRLSNLPHDMTLANFDFAFQPSIERSRIETLATCAWIRDHSSVLIQGPPGVGKTHLATALGVKTIENGFSAAFFRLDELLAALRTTPNTPWRACGGRSM